MIDTQLMTIDLILFTATFTRSTFGFGFGLMAMPLITLTAGLPTAVPLVAFVSLTIGGVITWSSRQQIDLQAARQLIIAAIAGIPIGLVLLHSLPTYAGQSFLGILVIALGSYHLMRPKLFTLEKSYWAYLFGFLAGTLGGAYNLPAPPIVIYGTLRRWSPRRFRATLQGFMFPTAVFVSIGHGVKGLWSFQVFQVYLSSLPLIFAAIFLGGKLNQRINPDYFQKFLYMGLILLGVMLLR